MQRRDLLKDKGFVGIGWLCRAGILLAAVVIATGCGDIGNTVPPPPSGFLLTAPTDSATISGTRPTLRWTDATGETLYHIQISQEPTFSVNYQTYSLSANTTSYVATGLTASVKYYWRVRAINESGVTYASNMPFSFLTTLSTSTGSGFALWSPADGAIVSLTPTLRWGDETDETQYYVEIDTRSDFATKFTASIPADTTSYTIPVSTLTSSTTYFWQVRAITGGGPVTAPNAPFSFTTASVVSLPSFTLTDPADGSTGVGTSPLLQWADIAGETGYRVSIDTNGALTTPFNFPDLPAGTTSLLVTSATYSLLPGTTYYWNVMALGLTIPASNGPFSFTP